MLFKLFNKVLENAMLYYILLKYNDDYISCANKAFGVT